MFHTGDLNSGISRAIQESKVVICFIRADDDHWSDIWEDYWLANKSQPMDMLEDPEPPLGFILSAKAVLLRIAYGSQEADFLNAFCPIEKVPTIAVIRNGQVLEKLEGGIGKEEFQERLLVACGMKAAVQNGAPAEQAESSHDAAESIPGDIPQSPDDVQSVFNERAQRLEAERRQREAAEKAERIARANARRKEAEEATANSNDKGKQRATAATTEEREKQQARDAWIYRQKQRKDEAKKERERILGQIESDKQERRAQKDRAKEVQTTGGAGAFSSIPGADHSQIGPSTLAFSNRPCALQIRLFDGSSIRGKFAPDTTLALAVRTWVKEASPEGGADIPYTFRQILAPQPSRSIEVSEEHQTLLDLGLIPNATLVLVPVAGFTNAYSHASGGYLSSAWNIAYNCASTASGILGSAISYIPGVGRLYMGGTSDPQESSNVEGALMAGSDSAPKPENVRVKTLFDQQTEEVKRDRDRDRAAEFYNGNSSAFEGSGPNRGEGEDER